MWEDLTITLCLLGFGGALALMLIELPALATQARQALDHSTRPTRHRLAHLIRNPERRHAE